MIILAATNLIKQIDDAFLRRFETIVEVKNPVLEDIIELYTRDTLLKKNLSTQEIRVRSNYNIS